MGLFEGLDARRDDGLGAEVGVVLLAEWLVAFAVPHFAEDAAAGARDAFDGVQGAIRVVLRFHARHEVAGRGVLEGDLSVFDEGFHFNSSLYTRCLYVPPARAWWFTYVNPKRV